MSLAELAALLEMSGEYVLYLYCILDGSEVNYSDEDLEDALRFESYLVLLDLGEE